MEKPVATPPRKSLRDFRFPTANGGYGYPLGQRSYRPRPFDSYCAALANKGWDVKKNSLAALALEFFLLTSPFIEPLVAAIRTLPSTKMFAGAFFHKLAHYVILLAT